VKILIGMKMSACSLIIFLKKMAAGQQAFDMQIKLLMIGESSPWEAFFFNLTF
jgi:hypothetical protein